jgi:hypothetical protein
VDREYSQEATAAQATAANSNVAAGLVDELKRLQPHTVDVTGGQLETASIVARLGLAAACSETIAGSSPIRSAYRVGRWRRTRPYSCQINPITRISNTVSTMSPAPCVYEKR